MLTLTEMAAVMEATAARMRETDTQLLESERERALLERELDKSEKDCDVLRLKLKQLQARLAALEGSAPPPDTPPSDAPPPPPPPPQTPGVYEGFGSIATGGAGKPVYNVTNLNNSGAGSLRDGLLQGNRIIKFIVGGTISLQGDIPVRGANITIDGLGAPAPGITLTGGGISIASNFGSGNLIVQGIRVRSGRAGGDGIVVDDASVIMIDRCSVSGWEDGGIDITNGSADVTIQWCIFGEGSDPAHLFANLITNDSVRVSVHHNFYYRSNGRNPRVASAVARSFADIRNNLVWEYSGEGMIVDGADANIINNYFGSTRSVTDAGTISVAGTGDAYVSGNVSQNGFNLEDNGDQASPFTVSLVPATVDALSAAHAVKNGAGARGPLFGLDATDLAYVATLSTLPATGGGGVVAGATFEVNFADAGSGVATLVPTVGAISATFTRASIGTAVLPTGLLKTDVASDVARVWHDPTTLTHLGVMIEGARTNVLLQSEDIGTTWVNSGSTESLDATTDPKGTSTADKIVETATTAEHGIQQNYTKPASIQQYTISNYLKAAQRTEFELKPRDGAKFVGQRLNLTTGVLDVASTATWTLNQAVIKQHPSSWWRPQITFTTDSNTLITSLMRMRKADAATYLGAVTDGAYIWGSQLELGAFASSYIQTTTASAPRAKDSLTYPISTLLGATENTYFVSARTAPGAGTQTLLSIDDGTVNERVTILRNSSNEIHCIVVDGGTTVADLNLGIVGHDTAVRVALRVKANDFAASLNGGAVVTDATGTLPTVTTLRVGQDHANTNEAFGPIKKVMQYATGRTNAELVTIAT